MVFPPPKASRHPNDEAYGWVWIVYFVCYSFFDEGASFGLRRRELTFKAGGDLIPIRFSGAGTRL